MVCVYVARKCPSSFYGNFSCFNYFYTAHLHAQVAGWLQGRKTCDNDTSLLRCSFSLRLIFFRIFLRAAAERGGNWTLLTRGAWVRDCESKVRINHCLAYSPEPQFPLIPIAAFHYLRLITLPSHPLD